MYSIVEFKQKGELMNMKQIVLLLVAVALLGGCVTKTEPRTCFGFLCLKPGNYDMHGNPTS